MTHWLDEDHPLRNWPLKVLNWIAGGAGWSSLARLCLVLGGTFLFAYLLRGPGSGAPQSWWLLPVYFSAWLLVPYGLWQLVEWRRRRERRRNPPIKTLNLP